MSSCDVALARLAALHPKLIDLGLERTFQILEDLGNPHHHLPPTLHLAGTNGKGSTAAFLRAMAEAAGLKVHVYSSPHLCRFHERIRLAGKLIDDAALAALLDEVEQKNAGKPITFFEVTTAAAFLAFSRTKADLLILETGLGGELDSTNVLSQPAATILTPIDRDHEAFLGSDLAGIARTKAGIMRANVPAVCAPQQPLITDTLKEAAAATGASYHLAAQPQNLAADRSFTLRFDDEEFACPPPALYGQHQIDNAALALSALYHARQSGHLQIDLRAAVSGLAHATWPGRIQRLTSGHLLAGINQTDLWLDGAHNAHGAAALVASLKSLSDAKWSLVVGLLNTRPAEAFFAQLTEIAGDIHAIAIPGQEASLSAEEVAQAAQNSGLKATPHPDLDTALASVHPDRPVAICGSLYLAGHVLSANGTLPD